jgi:hypothetical protein
MVARAADVGGEAGMGTAAVLMMPNAEAGAEFVAELLEGRGLEKTIDVAMSIRDFRRGRMPPPLLVTAVERSRLETAEGGRGGCSDMTT